MSDETLPDECLTLIFNFLTTTNDRNNSSLVSHRWLRIEAQTRTHLTLKARSDLQPFIPSIFTRFKSLTQLVLSNDYISYGINDDGLSLIALHCPNLTRLKLRVCFEITDNGMEILSQNCKNLKKFSCVSCKFASRGISALLDHCSSLEEISVKHLWYKHTEPKYLLPIGPATAASLLKVICLKGLSYGQAFEPLIIDSKNLKTLKLNTLGGVWDRCLEMIAVSGNCLAEAHFEYVDLSDVGLLALSKCSNLRVLRIVGLLNSINTGLISVAEQCKNLQKLHIGNGGMKLIGNEALIVIAKYCLNLEELVLIRVDACRFGLEMIAVNFRKLERLDLCSSKTITDAEISYIAKNCVALKKVLIKECCVSDKGVEAFAFGCPNLLEIRITECQNVTHEVKDRLRARRGSLVVKLDAVTTKAVECKSM